MRHLALIVPIALAACTAQPHTVALKGKNLNDTRVVAELTRALPQRERAAFSTFVLLHWSGSKAYCGRPMFRGNAEPTTVGEAIAATLEFDRDLAAKRARDSAPPSAGERLRREAQLLTDQHDQLTLERLKVMSADLPEADKQAKLADIAAQIASVRRDRERLRADR